MKFNQVNCLLVQVKTFNNMITNNLNKIEKLWAATRCQLQPKYTSHLRALSLTKSRWVHKIAIIKIKFRGKGFATMSPNPSVMSLKLKPCNTLMSPRLPAPSPSCMPLLTVIASHSAVRAPMLLKLETGPSFPKLPHAVDTNSNCNALRRKRKSL